MQYWGKLAGLMSGLMSGAGWWGALLGVMAGHLFDRSLLARRHGTFTYQQTAPPFFFHITFQVMGHLAKSKGRITETDIELASQLMDRMQLHGTERMRAQLAFSEGKHNEFPLREKLQQLRTICFGRFDLIRTFMEIQLQAAFTDGELHPNEYRVLQLIARTLGIARHQFEQLIREAQERQPGCGADGNHRFRKNRPHTTAETSALTEAYQILGVMPGDDSTRIKRAWRKLMSEHHPDKWIAKKDMPPEMMEQAKQKAQKIQAAWNLIKHEKGFK